MKYLTLALLALTLCGCGKRDCASMPTDMGVRVCLAEQNNTTLEKENNKAWGIQ